MKLRLCEIGKSMCNKVTVLVTRKFVYVRQAPIVLPVAHKFSYCI